jgi:calcineurin-like phosphoesterase family protein
MRNIAAQDTLIHLGDVIFYNYADLKDILDGIPGRKVLTMGNHDKRNATWYMNHGFTFAADAIVMGNIMFSHKPIKDFPSGVEYNVHGHLHNTGHRPQESWWDPGGRHRLFVLEHHYKPIELQRFMSDTVGKVFTRDDTLDSDVPEL